jgi:hypothetical protein
VKKIVVTLDLDSKKDPDYVALDKLMRDIGFSVVSPGKGIDLPCNTYMGTFSRPVSMEALRDHLWEALKAADLYPTALFGGELQDWALRVKK